MTLYEMSNGLFDITSGVLREVWRFDGSSNVPRRADVKRVLKRVGWHRVTWNRPYLTMAAGMQIDFGGVAKEYAVDRAAALAAETDDSACLLNFGGDLAAVGSATKSVPWSVGIESLLWLLQQARVVARPETKTGIVALQREEPFLQVFMPIQISYFPR